MKCSGFIAVSVDGFIARPDGGLDWLEEVARPGEDYGYARFAETVDTLVVGRGTYDAVLGFPEWPWVGKRVVVLTHRPSLARQGERFLAGTPAEIVASLAAEGAGHV